MHKHTYTQMHRYEHKQISKNNLKRTIYETHKFFYNQQILLKVALLKNKEKGRLERWIGDLNH